MIIARIIGAGKPTRILVAEITKVFFSVVKNMGLSKYCLKYFSPTNFPPVMPAVKLYSRNASWIPYMGT